MDFISKISKFFVLKCKMFVVSLFNNNKFAENHLFNCKNIFLLLLRKFVLLVTVITTIVASMKRRGKEYLPRINGRSLIYIRNNKGSRTVPCGTPQETLLHSVDRLSWLFTFICTF
jgi:hypothetical protein